MRKLIYTVIFLLSYFSICIAQEKETVYLLFEGNSSQTCSVVNENTNGLSNIKKYQKYSEDGDISFYICKELFHFDGKKAVPDTASVRLLRSIKLSTLEDLRKRIKRLSEQYPTIAWYPSSAFEKIYLIEQLNDSMVVKYNVKWQYYIE